MRRDAPAAAAVAAVVAAAPAAAANTTTATDALSTTTKNSTPKKESALDRRVELDTFERNGGFLNSFRSDGLSNRAAKNAISDTHLLRCLRFLKLFSSEFRRAIAHSTRPRLEVINASRVTSDGFIGNTLLITRAPRRSRRRMFTTMCADIDMCPLLPVAINRRHRAGVLAFYFSVSRSNTLSLPPFKNSPGLRY